MTCAFGPCTCTVEEGVEFCGPTCRFGIGDDAEPCKCGHAGCRATRGDG